MWYMCEASTVVVLDTVACRDYPHPRHLYAKFPFTSTPHEKHCDLCHCYVCDSLAPCVHWGTGASHIGHCHAMEKIDMWKVLRRNFKMGRSASMPAIKVSVAVPQLNQVPIPSIRLAPNSIPQNQVYRPSTIPVVSSARPTVPVATSIPLNQVPRSTLIRACPSTTLVNCTVRNPVRSHQQRSLPSKNGVQPSSASQQLLINAQRSSRAHNVGNGAHNLAMLAVIYKHIIRTQFHLCRSFSSAYAISLQNPSKNWQQLREDKLTASTFAAAVGFWPRQRVRLWREKIGAVKPFTGNLSTSWSNIKEEEALQRYKMITQHNVSSAGFRVHSTANWLAASPDGLIESSGVLEIRCPFFDGEKSRAWPWVNIPAQCVPQAQGLMEILDKEWMHFYVWTINGSSLFKLYRDREYWGVLEQALEDFWWKHVVPAREVYGNRSTTVGRTHLLLKGLRPLERHDMIERIVCESTRIVSRSELLLREVHGRMQN